MNWKNFSGINGSGLPKIRSEQVLFFFFLVKKMSHLFHWMIKLICNTLAHIKEIRLKASLFLHQNWGSDSTQESNFLKHLAAGE